MSESVVFVVKRDPFVWAVVGFNVLVLGLAVVLLYEHAEKRSREHIELMRMMERCVVPRER